MWYRGPNNGRVLVRTDLPRPFIQADGAESLIFPIDAYSTWESSFGQLETRLPYLMAPMIAVI